MATNVHRSVAVTVDADLDLDVISGWSAHITTANTVAYIREGSGGAIKAVICAQPTDEAYSSQSFAIPFSCPGAYFDLISGSLIGAVYGE